VLLCDWIEIKHSWGQTKVSEVQDRGVYEGPVEADSRGNENGMEGKYSSNKIMRGETPKKNTKDNNKIWNPRCQRIRGNKNGDAIKRQHRHNSLITSIARSLMPSLIQRQGESH